MKINNLFLHPDIDENLKLKEAYIQFEKLLIELRKKEFPDKLVASINEDIDELNSSSVSGDSLRKVIKKKQTRIITLLEKEHKVVSKGHYRNLWTAVGVGAFGVPIGVALGASLGNMAFLGIGLPLGVAIGVIVGTAMDKKAFDEGRQLDLEIKV